eukprot:TRINITY_DN1226_c0_g2_i1.p1 TRINITY_DN1226_c0_g2~~TRINITY_DN1226_c0_g2_i1.p1  ORF type:complete len:231 (-),score=36.16 TRINITY_DN1226_c0_g2_i1:478-1170(-)
MGTKRRPYPFFCSFVGVFFPCFRQEAREAKMGLNRFIFFLPLIGFSFLTTLWFFSNGIGGPVFSAPFEEIPVPPEPFKVGFLMGATGSYTKYLPYILNENFNRLVLANQTKYFFLLVDEPYDYRLALLPEYHDKIILINITERYFDGAMDRFKHATVYADLFQHMDYMYLLDVDLRVLDVIGDEILGDSVGTVHWCSLYFSGREIRGPGPQYDCPRGVPGGFLGNRTIVL